MSETAAGVLSNASPVGFLVGRIVSAGATTDVMINALEQKGIARSLAEPNLVALSGDTASFLAGGEYPIPVSGSFGSVTSTTRNMVLDLPSRRLINQSIDLGSRITDAMRVYSDDMRHKRLSMAEEKAYALPAKLASGAVRGLERGVSQIGRAHV